MKRKIVAVLLSAAMILSVTACGNSSSNSTSETNSQTSDTSDEASNEDAAADTLENSGAEESTEESAPSSTTVDFTGVKAEIDIDGTIIGDALTTFEAKVEEFNNLTGAQLELV